MITRKISAIAFLLLIAGVSHANYSRLCELTITNITKAQTFTPQLVARRPRSVSIFELGESASLGLEVMAEGDDTSGRTSVQEVCLNDQSTRQTVRAERARP